jgi:hypothetical protein
MLVQSKLIKASELRLGMEIGNEIIISTEVFQKKDRVTVLT